MCQAQKCPVCNGSGTVRHYPSGDSTSGPWDEACRGCGGRGWVTVSCNLEQRTVWNGTELVDSDTFNTPNDARDYGWDFTKGADRTVTSRVACS